MSQTTRYYIRVQGTVLGPYTLDQLERMERRGRITARHFFSSNQVDWKPLAELQALFPPPPKPEPEKPVPEQKTSEKPPRARISSRNRPRRRPVLPRPVLPQQGGGQPTLASSTVQTSSGVSINVISSTPPAAPHETGLARGLSRNSGQKIVIVFVSAMALVAVGWFAVSGTEAVTRAPAAGTGLVCGQSQKGSSEKSAGGEITVGLKSEIMDGIRQEQVGENWCWAACIQMVLRAHGFDRSQDEIVRRTLGATLDQGATRTQIAENLADWDFECSGQRYVLKVDDVPGPPPLIFMKDQLLLGRPLIIGYTQPQVNFGHAVVITAITYRLDADGEPRLTNVTVRDPSGAFSANRGKRRLSPAEFQNTGGWIYVVPF